MVRRWGRCVCAHPVNTAWPAAHPPPDTSPLPAISEYVSRKEKRVIAAAQWQRAWELGEAARIRRAAIKRGAPNNPSNKIIRMAVYLRDAGRCQLCGRPLNPDIKGVTSHDDPDRMTLDHTVPISKGGTHTYDNVRAACMDCNTEKGDDMPDEIPTTIVIKLSRESFDKLKMAAEHVNLTVEEFVMWAAITKAREANDAHEG
jgi:5-methylcytosine-specific restriction endonuclease McrA